jgi:inner membrane protein
MDPVTHALMGATLAAVVARDGPVRVAALVGAVAAVIPDLDVLISNSDDPLLQLEMHRQFTHSLLFAPIIGALLALAFGRVRRLNLKFSQGWLYATVGALSAGLLDACTSYGTQLLWPFADTRIAWNVVAVIDPVITLALLVAAAVSLKRDGSGAAAVGGAAAISYLFAGAIAHDRAEWVARSLASERGHIVESVQVKPTLGNHLVWRSVYKANGRYWVDAVRTGYFSTAMAYPGTSIAALDVGALGTLTERQQADIERFTRLSSGYVVNHPSRRRVVADIRYAMQPDSDEPLWGIKLSNAGSDDPEVEWRTFRELDELGIHRFREMLLGSTLEPLTFVRSSERTPPAEKDDGKG